MIIHLQDKMNYLVFLFHHRDEKTLDNLTVETGNPDNQVCHKNMTIGVCVYVPVNSVVITVNTLSFLITTPVFPVDSEGEESACAP